MVVANVNRILERTDVLSTFRSNLARLYEAHRVNIDDCTIVLTAVELRGSRRPSRFYYIITRALKFAGCNVASRNCGIDCYVTNKSIQIATNTSS